MNVLQNISFSIINLTPPWFFNILNFSSLLWVQWLGSLALLFLIRMIYVFIKTKIRFSKIKKTSFDELDSLVKETGKSYPKFSIIVPARNEADVVEKTIIKLTELNYPKESFEIVVITDEKEILQNRNNEVTTQDVISKTIENLKDQSVKIWHLDVPYNFDGMFHGELKDHEIKSTKGRALNYAFTKMFEHFNSETDFFAFFDTDDHPDRNCLIEIAKENLLFPQKKVFQMPIFQCRNF
jgi:cellulose synthase/poly-beta-1,6-N-acetylglucosamine synthase-like glycosyltransferase